MPSASCIDAGSFRKRRPSPAPRGKSYEVTVRQSPLRTGQLSPAARPQSDARHERVIAYLQRRYPTKTPESVEADTGIKAATVQKWIVRRSAPGFAAMFRLLCAYGPELLCVALDNPPAWLDEAARAEEAKNLKAQIAALNAKLEAL